jgi:predicted nucleic-acid-binding protein
MRAVDTNVLVRLATRDDPRQLEAAESFVGQGAWVSHLVLLEFTWVLRSVYALDPRQVGSAIEVLLSHEHLILQDPETIRLALSACRKKPSLPFSDCLVLEVARRAGHTPLGTFDRHLGRLPGAEKL